MTGAMHNQIKMTAGRKVTLIRENVLLKNLTAPGLPLLDGLGPYATAGERTPYCHVRRGS